MARPFVRYKLCQLSIYYVSLTYVNLSTNSTKFWRKLVYVKSLDELGLHVIVEKAAIPEKVKQYDAKRH